MKKEQTTVDVDFAEAAVPQYARRGIVTMFMIMLGFTFFSASMWVGQELADGLDFGGFLVSLIIGGFILSLYTGLLGYVGAETGMSLDLLARKALVIKRDPFLRYLYLRVHLPETHTFHRLSSRRSIFTVSHTCFPA